MAKDNIQLYRPVTEFYGISHQDGELRKWIDSGQDTSDLIISWPGISTPFGESLADISIAVAQSHPKAQIESVKRMANDIYNGEKIEMHDSILRIDQQNHVKVGWVSAKERPENQEIKISVEWVAGFDANLVKNAIISENGQFQKIKLATIKKIERKLPKIMEKAYNLMPESELKFLESKISVKSERLEMVEELSETPKEDSGGLINLFYGTNRNLLRDRKDVDFGDEETDELKYGKCVVGIPAGHVKGELERPGNLLFWKGFENKNIHISLEDCALMELEHFKEMFQQKLAEKEKKHGLLFVHGFRTTFKEAAYRTAQLAWDLPFSGFAGFFSWPSAGKLTKYSTDEAAARSAALVLRDFIKEILEINELEQLHIIGHSMGGLVLTLSLKEITTDPIMAPNLDKIFQLILGAPDIDKKEFQNTIMPSFNKLGKRRTIYASDHDFALGVSSYKRSFRERLGQAIEGIFVGVGIDSIEASNIRSVNNHSYIFESDKVLSDLHYLITQNLSPADRRLREVRKSPINYWLFPK